FLDQDDRIAPEKLARQVALAGRHPAAGIVACDGSEATESAAPGGGGPLLHPDLLRRASEAGEGVEMHFYRSILNQCPIATFGQTLMPRAVFQRLGPLQESQDVAPDHEFYLRVSAAG